MHDNNVNRSLGTVYSLAPSSIYKVTRSISKYGTCNLVFKWRGIVLKM